MKKQEKELKPYFLSPYLSSTFLTKSHINLITLLNFSVIWFIINRTRACYFTEDILYLAEDSYVFAEDILYLAEDSYIFVEDILYLAEDSYIFVKDILYLAEDSYIFVEDILYLAEDSYIFVKDILYLAKDSYIFMEDISPNLTRWRLLRFLIVITGFRFAKMEGETDWSGCSHSFRKSASYSGITYL